MSDTNKPTMPDGATDSPKRRSLTLTMPELPRPKTPGFKLRSGLLALTLLLVALLGGIAGGMLEYQRDASDRGISLGQQKKVITSQSLLISQIAKAVGPSVVSVNVTIGDAATVSPLDSFFGYTPSGGSIVAAGTGIILNDAGIVITNRHVVPVGTTTVSVTLSDGTELKDVTVLGRTSSTDTLDIAFLKINNTKGHKLKAASIGDSSKVAVGDDVVAIGNALGQFQNTVTSGIISGFGRSVQASSGGAYYTSSSDTENLDNLFQTDAAINEGNSGGPLVNLNGQVIGINTAVAGNAQNIGFAIPVNDVKGLVAGILKNGKITRPYLGVHYVLLSADIAKQYDLSVNNGAFIAPATDATQPSVVTDSPADKAGVKERDVITKIDGKTIDLSHSLISLLGQHQPGDKVSLTILREGKTQNLHVTLGTAPEN